MIDQKYIEQAKKVASNFGRTKEEREDLEGRCLEIAWKLQPKIVSELNPEAFIARAMKNTAIDYLKLSNKKTSLELPLKPELEAPDCIEELTNILVTEEKIERFISSLSSKDKEIVLLLLQGYTIKEIGSKLKINPNSVRVRLFRRKEVWEETIKK